MVKSIDECVRILIARRIIESDEMIPCSEDDVEVIERGYGTTLPQSFRRYLMTMGRGAGAFMQSTDFFYPELLRLTEAARQLVEENADRMAQLPSDAFVLSMHQGYEFDYMRSSEGEEPPVYHCVEGERHPVRNWVSFVDFFFDMVRLHTEI